MALSFFKFPTQLLPSFSSFCNSQYYTASILPVKILDSSPSKSFFTSVSPVSSYTSYFSRPFEEKEEQEEDDEEENAIGDCIVFEEDAFEDPYLWEKFEENSRKFDQSPRKSKSKQNVAITENLIPEEWKEVQQELNLTKKEKRRISQELQFGSRMRRRNRALPNMEDYLAYRSMKLSQLKPVVLDNPDYPLKEATSSSSVETENVGDVSTSSRVAPRNPRVAVAGDTFEDVVDFFNSNDYEPGENGIKKSQGPRKLFTKEEKALLNKRTPKLEDATSSKWIPLHTLAAAGEFYLVDMLLKCNADINATNKDHLTALHKVIVCKKQAITNYLLRESANPFVRDNEGATLLHYAVLVASVPAIKTLLLYNVDINLPDNYGWTPLHLAVQTRRTDIVKLLLIKGADKTLKNQDGLTPLGLCLYSGRDMRTYELVKLLKEVPKSK